MFKELLQSSEKKIFLRENNKTYSYRWLHETITKTIGLFRSLHLEQGDRLLLAVSDEREMSVIFLSALAAGIVVVVADPEMKAPRATSIAKRAGALCIIADKASLDDWQLSLPAGCTVIPFIKQTITKAGLLSKYLKKNTTEHTAREYASLLQGAVAIETYPQPAADDLPAYIIFTSGTTMDTKGVCITHGSLRAHLATLKRVYQLNAQSKIFNQLLLCHADGCIQGPVLAAYAGCEWHRPFRFSLDKIPTTIDYWFANNVSHIVVVPAMLNMLVQFADIYSDSFLYPEFKALISVSAHLEAPLWDKFEAIFKIPVNNVYGLTETVAGSLFCGPMAGTHKKYTAGKPVDCLIRIIDSLENDVSDGECGELLLKGPHIMEAYWDNNIATEQAFKDGWFYTGDLASKDQEGFVTIKGRKKNVIISGGINIQPEEVTECLYNNEEISEACAIGLPDEVFGEKLVAAVSLKENSKVTSFEIIEYCRKNLEDKKVPHKIFILPELPKGVSGKIQLNLLKEQLLQKTGSVVESTGQYLDEIIFIAADAFQVPSSRLSIKDTSDSIDGWDSLAHLVFITSIEEKFEIRFNTAEIITMNSIKKAHDLVKMKYAQQR